MRTLILNRQKNALGAWLKLKIFIEDANGKNIINNTACTLLGVLKNGKTGSYSISAESKKMFISASLIFTQKKTCYYQIPEGGDIELFLAPTGDIENPQNIFGVWTKEGLMVEISRGKKW